jgi:hypothetical protein
MMNKKFLTLLLATTFTCLSSMELKAQESVNAGGGNVVNSDVNISYSIGQVFVAPVTYSQGSVTPGIQQPYEISLVSGLPKVAAELKIQAYPNPAIDYLLLSFPEYRKTNYSLRLIDMAGKTLYLNEIKEEISRIEVQSLTSGLYFLQVLCREEMLKVFKVIKK